MGEFQPYTIHHVRLDEAGKAVLPPGNHYVVFWREGVPLGHWWVESPDKGVELKEYGREIQEAVRPALEYFEKEGFGSIVGGVAGLSVVICTRNRPEDLRRCIRSLMASRDTDFELIVIDNAPDGDATREVVSGFPGVNYYREERPGLDIARNTGARQATRALIAYTDDDVELNREWTSRVKSAFGDPLVMAVTGMVIPAQLDTRAQYLFERYWGFNKGYVPRMFDHGWWEAHSGYGPPVWEIGAGANMAFRREIFLLAGWFDERLDVGAAGCSGDSEMWYRVLAEGWNCHYRPELVAYHHHRRSMAELRQQLFYYMRGHVCALLVQYEQYGRRGERNRLLAGLPLYYLKRTAQLLLRGRRGRAANGNLLTEVKGCVSGWRFYRGCGKGVVRPAWEVSMRHPGGYTLKEAVVTKETLVSVIIPCHNHGRYLDDAIRSVKDQTHASIEIVVIDDDSMDDTKQVCRRYAEVRYRKVGRVGPCAARNIGVQICSGEFVVFLDADDILYPQALELNLYFFDYYPDAAFVSGAHDRMDGAGRWLEGPVPQDRVGENYKALLMGNYIGMEATVMYRKELFFKYFFDPAVRVCEDYDLNLRIARNLPVYGHSHKLAAYRLHGQNRSSDRAYMYHQAIRVLRRQERYLRDEEERACYEQGLKNWKRYYL